MASGHVSRINRPNTWLHRPCLQREESPCQLGAVHTWHFSTDCVVRLNVCCWGKNGHDEKVARLPLLTHLGHAHLISSAVTSRLQFPACAAIHCRSRKLAAVRSAPIFRAILDRVTTRILMHSGGLTVI